MLYLVATPIGNLGDITFRAVEVLKHCDVILCEDTRHSGKLLNHYEITTPRKSYHMFNEARREPEILERLRNGQDVALISDAGTPGISDPGQRLVRACAEAELPVTAIPGPCAAIQGLVASGLDSTQFQFLGFLPKKPGKLRKALQAALDYPGTSIVYESPHRLHKSLKALAELSPETPVVVARELTKKFEEYRRGTAPELLEHYLAKPPKGEIVLLIGKP